MTPVEYLAAALVLGGTFFGFVATVGLLRLPDLYSRLHAASKSDTLGSVLAIAGTATALGASTESMKMVFLLLFLFLTSPTAAHAIARAGREQEVEPVGEEASWDDATGGERQ
ncbi:monovalent cation/H(+) antiporter subunit G [Haloplanus litoreus]|uniref:Monovalent cation/H(+) antiporter subunit G n=1 Tax=Haloplanus litoreus TaxID=767515 RepID=A0ABD5ZZY1_9EURY